MTGVIGNVVSVDFHWLLNTSHGADYFRRWHRNKENSGGLLVHKATHHFDLVNWWLSTVPESVFAIGKRNFYTPQTAERYGLKKRGERCLDCPDKKKCKFYLNLADYADLTSLYRNNESYDGYFRDRCVFSNEIDIEDTMHVIVKYQSGATMSYSLHAFMPWEGYVIAFNGTRGRLEHKCMESVYVSGDGTIPGELLRTGTSTMVFPHFGRGYSVPIWEGRGGHGGGDDPLLDSLFLPKPPYDKYLRSADERAGAYSILTGVAANVSIKEKREVSIKELVGEIDMPDYPPMPSAVEPINLSWQHPSAKMASGVGIKKMIASKLQKKQSDITKAKLPAPNIFVVPINRYGVECLHDIRPIHQGKDGSVYLKGTVQMKKGGKGRLLYGADGPVKVWVNGKEADCRPNATNPAVPGEYYCFVDWLKGKNEIIFVINTNCGKAWGVIAECKYL